MRKKENKAKPRHSPLSIFSKLLVPASLLPRGSGPTTRAQPVLLLRTQSVGLEDGKKDGVWPTSLSFPTSWAAGWRRGLQGWRPHLLMPVPAAPQTWSLLTSSEPDLRGGRFHSLFLPMLSKRAPQSGSAEVKAWRQSVKPGPTLHFPGSWHRTQVCPRPVDWQEQQGVRSETWGLGRETRSPGPR